MLEPAVADLLAAEKSIDTGDLEDAQGASSTQPPAAAANDAPGPDTQARESSGALSEREMLVMEAAWEIDALSQTAYELLWNGSEDPRISDHYASRTVLRRIRRLASVQSEAIGDPGVGIDHLRERCHDWTPVEVVQ
jgi:hypothetical protein